MEILYEFLAGVAVVLIVGGIPLALLVAFTRWCER